VLNFIQKCFRTFVSSACDTDITEKRSGSSIISFIAVFTENKTINKWSVSEIMFSNFIAYNDKLLSLALSHIEKHSEIFAVYV